MPAGGVTLAGPSGVEEDMMLKRIAACHKVSSAGLARAR
jgi:hypothetical protein